FIRFQDEAGMRRPRGHAEDVDGGQFGQGEGEGCAHTIMLCADVCKLKVSTDRNKSWTEGRRFFVCPNYAHDRRRPTNAYDIPPSPPPLCKYFTWIDHEVPKDVQEDQRRDWLRRQRLFEESYARGLEREHREKEARERKKREEERARKEKEARQEERARKLVRARDAREEDEAREKKGKWPRTT
ncbi:hypothetical protein CFC21_044691, partial [Triticum aestivum]